MHFLKGRSVERNSGIANWSTGGGLVAIILWSVTIAVVRSLSERTGPALPKPGQAASARGNWLCFRPVTIRPFSS